MATARRKREPDPPRLVVVEGSLGVGKTAFASAWAARAGAREVALDVDANPFLEEALKDPTRRAFSAQMYFLLARHRQHQSLRQGELFSRSVVCDGLFQRDRLYAQVLLSEDEMLLYERIYRILEAHAVRPDLVVWLWARPPRVLERIRARGLERERPIRIELLQRLIAAYVSFFDRWKSAPLVSVDVSDVDLTEQLEATDSVVSSIRRLARELGPSDRAEVNPTRRG